MKKYLLFLQLCFALSFNINAQQFGQFGFQNRLRSYWMYLPKNYAPTEKLPLVIQMHGFTLDGKFHMQYTGFNELADTARCIVVYPDGINKRWNSGTFFFVQSNVDDVGFLSELIDRMHLKYNIDLEKVYASGYSAGGFMCYKLACDMSNRIAAVAPVVASMVYDNINSCVPSRPFPVIACNGADDPVTAYNGIPLNFPSIDTIKQIWQEKNICDVNPTIDSLPNTDLNDNSTVVTYTYNNCADAVTTKFYKVLKGGHTWAGAPNLFLGLIGNTNNDIKWNQESWNFFKQNAIPQNSICEAPQNLLASTITTDSFQLSWDAIPNASNYKVCLLDSAKNVISSFLTNTNTFNIKISDDALKYNWSVASNCNSGYRNWAAPQALNYVLSKIKTSTIKNIKIYPNPTSSYLQFEIPNRITSNVDIMIYDISGKVVHQETSDKTLHKLSVSHLPNGIYILNCITNEGVYQNKFFKE